jgi:hypothetical protein
MRTTFSSRLFSLETILARGSGCQGLLSGRTLTPGPSGVGLTKEKRRGDHTHMPVAGVLCVVAAGGVAESRPYLDPAHPWGK